ncbi:uncharacterized protein BDW43DRAFT_310151 [Aspergillus alliaceus]|uniref:uncharacterized protein n=1 Tax=Petromyces alliaceus TaxID=209559 RepID=UPI0012A52809|nr:uncharacterized protein BDW43DRAFT_310151 [Aspergillus alliaceus]KAB8234488.1 hypothetical protein BDW43DRAFT_310151 [Aspergillus alliaceus]
MVPPTLFNAFVIGAVGFLNPGLWNAMSLLGAGGVHEPYLVNAANALVFCLMGFLCLFSGSVANCICLAWTLFLSAVGYPVYSAGLYMNNCYGTEWKGSAERQLRTKHDAVAEQYRGVVTGEKEYQQQQRVAYPAWCGDVRCLRRLIMGKRGRCGAGVSGVREARPVHEFLAVVPHGRPARCQAIVGHGAAAQADFRLAKIVSLTADR